MIQNIKPYFTGKMAALGFTEWEDGFADDNIPATLLDKSFHQLMTLASGTAINQESFEIRVSQQVKVFLKGFRDPAQAIAEGLVSAQSIIASSLKVKDYKAAGITGLFFDSFTVDPLAEFQNDNVIVITLNFEVLTFNCID